MKKVLLGTTALLGVGVMAGTAAASDGIKLSLGGFYRTSYSVVIDDDSEGEPGNDRNTDNLFTDGEVHFNGETTLDNGLTVGVRVELEAEQEGDQIDESYAYFSGGFGEVRLGNDDSALQGGCITPPGATANFGATSPSHVNYNDAISTAGAIVAPTSQSVCTGVDGDATKVVYYSPNWSGFSFALSYTPDGDTDNGVTHGFTKGMSAHADASSRHNVSTYLSYSYEGDGWGLTWGGGADFEGEVDGNGRDAADFYQTGLNLNFGGLSVGGAFEYYNDFAGTETTDNEGWVAGFGVAYNVDAWTVGIQYTHLDFENDSTVEDGDDFDVTRDRVALTGNYEMGPGINLDATLAYTWVDVSNAEEDSAADGQDNYDAFEIGVGTSFAF